MRTESSRLLALNYGIRRVLLGRGSGLERGKATGRRQNTTSAQPGQPASPPARKPEMRVRWRAGFRCECCSARLGARGGEIVRRVPVQTAGGAGHAGGPGQVGGSSEVTQNLAAVVLLCGSAELGTGCAGLVGERNTGMSEDAGGFWLQAGRDPGRVPIRRRGGDGAAIPLWLSGSEPRYLTDGPGMGAEAN